MKPTSAQSPGLLGREDLDLNVHLRETSDVSILPQHYTASQPSKTSTWIFTPMTMSCLTSVPFLNGRDVPWRLKTCTDWAIPALVLPPFFLFHVL